MATIRSPVIGGPGTNPQRETMVTPEEIPVKPFSAALAWPGLCLFWA